MDWGRHSNVPGRPGTRSTCSTEARSILALAGLQRPKEVPHHRERQDCQHGVSGPAADAVHEITGQSLDIQTRHPPDHALLATGQRLPYWQAGWGRGALGVASHAGFPSGRLTSSNVAT
jgi:predicted nucleic acid-binding Zn ribbon protein